MMKDNPYEMIPHKILAELRDEVDDLKNKLNEPDSTAKELIIEMGSLKDALHDLHSVFQTALEHAKEDEFTNKIEIVVKQNETIASGMIAISEKLEKFMEDQKNKVQEHHEPLKNVQHSMGMPAQPRTAPPIDTLSQNANFSKPNLDMPPPPPSMGKKRGGLF